MNVTMNKALKYFVQKDSSDSLLSRYALCESGALGLRMKARVKCAIIFECAHACYLLSAV